MGSSGELKYLVQILKGASALSAFVLFLLASEYFRVTLQNPISLALGSASLFFLYLFLKVLKFSRPGTACFGFLLIYFSFLQFRAEKSFSRLSDSSFRCEGLILPYVDLAPGRLCTLTYLKRRLRFVKPEFADELIEDAFRKFAGQGRLNAETASVLMAFYQNEHPGRGQGLVKSLSELREELDFLETKASFFEQFDSPVSASESGLFRKEFLNSQQSFEYLRKLRPNPFPVGEQTLVQLRIGQLERRLARLPLKYIK